LLWWWRMIQTWSLWHYSDLKILEVVARTSFGCSCWSSCSFEVEVVGFSTRSSCFGWMNWTSSSFMVVGGCSLRLELELELGLVLELLRLSQQRLRVQFVWYSLVSSLYYRFVRSKQVLVSLVLHNHHQSSSWPRGNQPLSHHWSECFSIRWVWLLPWGLEHKSIQSWGRRHCVRIGISHHTGKCHLCGIECKAWSWSCLGDVSSSKVGGDHVHMSRCYRTCSFRTSQSFCTTQSSFCSHIVVWTGVSPQNCWIASSFVL